ncbi:mRNA-decapping enzyme-like protein isoform X2 [Bidens hawaiensis]|uniref:mRNA-decapping enzyme-like protein isoform X2 n=1 Tax=Bidens hawaiensis TaxID=980011 RepID=UPI0040490CDB
MSQSSGKLMPNLDQNSTKILNLTVLQRMDPYIEEILITAAHVTFYEFNVDLNQWSRKDVEGSLFVVKRNTQPRFQFIVMNRRIAENLVENLLGDFEFELQLPYLLYRNASQEVNGIWFYNARECEDVANLFTRILGAYSKVPSKQKVNKSEFEELEAVPTSAVIEGPLEPGLTTSRSTDVPEDSSFINFFSNAMNLGHNNNTPNPVNSIQPSHVVNNPPLQIPSSAPPMPPHDSVDQVNSTNHLTDLIKPLSFFTPSSASSTSLVRQSSTPVPVSALQPPLNVQRSVGIPLLQPFPPPTPPASLTPTAGSGQYYGPLTREKVRDALVLLAQDNQFIDMFYHALLKAHQS